MRTIYRSLTIVVLTCFVAFAQTADRSESDIREAPAGDNKDTAERAAPSTPAEQRLDPGNHFLTLKIGDINRTYLIHVPRGYNGKKPVPVVIMFHGGGGRAESALWDTGWAEKADSEGFLAVFPEGTPPDTDRPGSFTNNPQTWNDGSRRPTVGAAQSGVEDMKFVSVMLDDLKERFNVDTHRIYATGFSNGASMSFRLARDLSSEFAAIAPVAGVDWLSDKKPSRPVPVLYITGTADPLNPIEGGEIHIGAKSFGRKPSSREMIEKWVELHGCRETPHIVTDENGARKVAYACADGAEVVVFCTIDGHGHHWPGGRVVLPAAMAGKNTAKLKATDVIWNFFTKHSK
jgi:polyhydroxybutyrate depolymerase